MRQFVLSVWEVIEVILIAAVTVFLIRAFVVQPFLVSGASMEPNFVDGDYLLVDELTYRFKNPERGDVIVFRYPLNPRLFYIKRVIGVEGERVVVADGSVFIDEKQLTEKYLAFGTRTAGWVDTSLEARQFFVMGDNRPHSYDSRNWGTVPFENIIGVVRIRLLPAPRTGIIERPAY